MDGVGGIESSEEFRVVECHRGVEGPKSHNGEGDGVFIDPIVSEVPNVVDHIHLFRDFRGEDEDGIFLLGEVLETLVGRQVFVTNDFVSSSNLTNVGLVVRVVKHGDEPVRMGHGWCKFLEYTFEILKILATLRSCNDDGAVQF